MSLQTTQQKLIDPFNWPALQKKDTMSLSQINQLDIGYSKFNPIIVRNACLKADDIEGAKPEIRAYRYTNKQDFVNTNKDIERSSPKQVSRNLASVDYTLKIDDIKGTQPQVNTFTTKREPSNPLQPQYRLPSYEIVAQQPTKFIRDSIDISDIEGTKPFPHVLKPRKTNIYTEIQGSVPKVQQTRKQVIDSLNVKDINTNLEGTFQTNRQTNPIMPEYNIQGENKGEVIRYGQIIGSVPIRRHPIQVNKELVQLTTKDIIGAQSDTLANRFLRKLDRKDYIAINRTSDIFGAQSGTLKKGIATIRQTDPLMPTYQFLGAKEGVTYQFNNTAKVFPSTSKSLNQNVFTQTANNNLAKTDTGSMTQNLQQIKKHNKKPVEPEVPTNIITHQPLTRLPKQLKNEVKQVTSKISIENKQNQTQAEKLDKFITK